LKKIIIIVSIFIIGAVLLGLIYFKTGSLGSYICGAGYHGLTTFITSLIFAGVLVYILILIFEKIEKKKCLNCNKSVKAEWSTCPYCGRELED